MIDEHRLVAVVGGLEFRALIPELVPAPLWGTSGANLLSRSRWRRIRETVIAEVAGALSGIPALMYDADMGKTTVRRLPAAVGVIGVLAAPGIAQAAARPAIQAVSINSANRTGSTFKVSVQAVRAREVGVCVAFGHTTACEYAARRGRSFTARFHIAGARRSSRIAYSISASGPGGHRFKAGSLVENSGTGTTTVG